MRRRAAIPDLVARLVRALAFCAVLLSFASAGNAEGAFLSERDPSSGSGQPIGPLGSLPSGPVDAPPVLESDTPCERIDPTSEESLDGETMVDSPPPTPSVRLELIGCTRQTQGWECEQPPVLRFVGVAASSEDPIVNLYVEFDGMPADCEGPTCEVPLEPTAEEGSEVMFSFDTISNEASELQFALVRVVEADPLEGC